MHSVVFVTTISTPTRRLFIKVTMDDKAQTLKSDCSGSNPYSASF